MINNLNLQMCGIVGIISQENSIPSVLTGLKSLEYRGYDSAGIGFVNNERLNELKCLGKISNLSKKYKKKLYKSLITIGHTRWATHGKPSKLNAHPFLKDNCCLVHNGIIENYRELITKYKIKKSLLKSETDSEVIAEIINKLIKKKTDIKKICLKLIKEIKGTFSFAIIIKDENCIIAFKKGSPLIIGINENEMSLSSDILGLPKDCKKIIYLEDYDLIKMTSDNYEIINNGKNIKRKIQAYIPQSGKSNKGKFKHFMLKEIYDQPKAINDILLNFLNFEKKSINFPKSNIDFNKINKIHLTACGTAYHACMIAKYWFEEFTSILTSVDISSEYRYRKCTLDSDSLGIVVSQSGETMDTLESLKKYVAKNIETVSIVNVLESTIARKSNYVIPTIAGPEIGVASTKAFTSQLLVLALFTIFITNKRYKNRFDRKIYISLLNLSGNIRKNIKKQEYIKKLIPILKKAKSIFYIGRGTMYPLALEGALKLKEITYKHCEGYAAGELKHGPLALIEKNIPVIVLAPYNDNFDKIISNIQEVKARNGQIIVITDKNGFNKIKNKAYKFIIMPESNEITAPILYSIPIQLIAYNLAKSLGTNIDQPRNLAKSVTVE